MAEITREQIEELRGLLPRATLGPWSVRTMRPNTLGPVWIDAPNMRNIADCGNPSELTPHGFCAYVEPHVREANAALIAAMRNALPALLDLAESNLANKPKGGDADGAGIPGNATSLGVTAGASDADRASRMLMEAADFFAATRAQVDPRAWEHLLVYAPKTTGASEIEELCKRLGVLAYDQQLLPSERRDFSEAAALIRRLVAERDNARSECAWLAKLLIRLREALNNIADGAEDEGDRVYFGSTNDADWLKEIACEVDSYAFDRITRKVKWPDYIEASAKANARATAAEAHCRQWAETASRQAERIDALTEEAERLRVALRETATAWMAGDTYQGDPREVYETAMDLSARNSMDGKSDG